jgi:hypothetical protein
MIEKGKKKIREEKREGKVTHSTVPPVASPWPSPA